MGTFDNMYIRIFRIIGTLFLAGGLALFFYFCHLSYVYATHGANIKDDRHVIQLSWHGDVSWISESQSERLKFLLLLSIVIFLFGVIFDAIKKHLIKYSRLS